MPFIKEIWLKNTCEVLDAIADPDFLRDAWSGKSRYVSSSDEIYNNVFSDSVIDEYADPDLALDEAQKAAGKAFIDNMEQFDQIGGPELPRRAFPWARAAVGHRRFPDTARILRHAGVGKWPAKSLAGQRLEFSDRIFPTPGRR